MIHEDRKAGGETIVQFPVKINNSINNLNSNLISPGHYASSLPRVFTRVINKKTISEMHSML